VRLWVAQGFGVGRIPFAPGTFGSLVGLAWSALLLGTGSLWLFAAGTALGLGLSVWLCGYAEQKLGRKDPGSVVLDEIAAMPVCFGAWVALHYWREMTFPAAAPAVWKANWLPILCAFAAFRLFDIWKPWPVRQSQGLPGGWGITVDDLLAAIYVSALGLVWGVVKT
jgi:phosphatidylglycerophosphatase A